MIKSIGVVIGSYILSVLLVFASDPLLSLLFPGDFVRGRIPSNSPLFASLACFVTISILCAWLCARWSQSQAPRNVLWFFGLGELMGIGAIIPNWSNGWPHWYWISWLLAWPVSCWIGLQLAQGWRARKRAT